MKNPILTLTEEKSATTTLDEIDNSHKFRIVRLIATGEIRRRLIDMGFVSGTKGTVLREGLLKDPIEIHIKGYKISIRRAEARTILVEKIDEHE